jgi:tripartite ATP-independent transporter DctM subunit
VLFGGLLLLLFLGIPVAFAFAIMGTGGLLVFAGGVRDLFFVSSAVHDSLIDAGLLSIPLFVLMAELLQRTRLPAAMFAAIERWLGAVPGRLPITTVLAGAVFGAISGSSIASAAVLGRVSLAEMVRRGYDGRLAAGTVASAGTLALIIPPSLSLILFGLITGTSIGELFMAGIGPGLCLVAVFSAYIWLTCRGRPELKGAPATAQERIAALRDTWPIFLVIAVVLGSIYGGITTTTEAAAVGVVLALLIGLAYRDLGTAELADALRTMAIVTGYLMLILVCNRIFTQVLSLLEVPSEFARSVMQLQPNRYVTILIITVVYLILGMLMDGISLIVLLTPIFFPILSNLGFDPVWQGIYVTVMVEIGLITPPVGINLFTIAGVAREQGISFLDISRGAVPFVLLALGVTVLLVLVPEIALWLPSHMRR